LSTADWFDFQVTKQEITQEMPSMPLFWVNHL